MNDKVYVVVETNHRFGVEIIKAVYSDYDSAAEYAERQGDPDNCTYVIVACDYNR